MPPLKAFYFSEFEDRKPPAPLPYSARVEWIWQCLAAATIGLGLWYLYWRWTSSLNPEAMWFSIPVACAETCAYLGLLLYFYNLWSVNDPPQTPAPKTWDEVSLAGKTRPISVDVFLPTYDEDPELVRYSIRDAKAIRYPHPIDVTVYVLDDGRRPLMRRVAEEEGAAYITRATNIGYKAGNLRNGMEQSSGDFIVILDADTRPFPTILENTLGYFRDPDVAWVQTPQWFYDIPEGTRLSSLWEQRAGAFGAMAARACERVLGPVHVNEDPFINDPKLFYDVILRRRNRAGASFCCGAGSVHRRNAVMFAALKEYSSKIDTEASQYTNRLEKDADARQLDALVREEVRHKQELTPYKFHVSEDIYTSILLHSEESKTFKSVLHPNVESKMLSPQDLKSWVLQRFKYAGGSLDILFHDNPLLRKGMSREQKLFYGMTFYSYLAPLWNVIFIAAPLIALFTGISPVDAYSSDFFLHLLPFLIIHELASMVGSWGIDNRKGRMLNLAFFWINLKALWTVALGREIKFHVTPKQRIEENSISFVIPQITIVVLTIIGLIYASAGAILSQDPALVGSLIVNGFWALMNANAMTVLIFAAIWRPKEPDTPSNVVSLTAKRTAT